MQNYYKHAITQNKNMTNMIYGISRRDLLHSQMPPLALLKVAFKSLKAMLSIRKNKAFAD